MNRNRMLMGLAFAVVVAVILSSFVYRAFKNASAVKPVSMQHIVVASSRCNWARAWIPVTCG